MSLKDEAYEFIERAEDHKTLDTLYADFTAVIERHGFTGFVLTGIPELGDRIDTVILKSTYPKEWSKRYRDRHYEFADPVGRMTVQSVKPFTWIEAGTRHGQDRAAVNFTAEAMDAGLRDGFAVPMFDAKTFQAVVSMASDRRTDLPRADQGALSMIAIYFKMAVDGLTELPQATIRITPREREILAWAAAGKSRWEVSSILGISEGTVKTHLASIHAKFNVANTTHAITKAIRHRLISP